MESRGGMGRRGGSVTCGEERRGKKGSVVGIGMLKQSSSGSLSPQSHSRSSSGVRVMSWSRNCPNWVTMWVVLDRIRWLGSVLVLPREGPVKVPVHPHTDSPAERESSSA